MTFASSPLPASRAVRLSSLGTVASLAFILGACAAETPTPLNQGPAGVGSGQGTAPGTGAGAPSGTASTNAGGTGTAANTGGGETAGTGTAPANTGATTGGTGTTSGSDSTSGGEDSFTVECTNANTRSVPMDDTGWVWGDCNDAAIQGAWYCYADAHGTHDCVENTPPFDAASGQMCMRGSTVEHPEGSYDAWGAGIGLGLSESGGTNSTKAAFDAAAIGITGFEIGLSGDSGGLPIRIGFTGTTDTEGKVTPFYEVPGVGEYPIAFTDAIVPTAWDVENAGEEVNASAIYDIQVQVIGGDLAADYDVCITHITPIFDPSVTPPVAVGGSGGGAVDEPVDTPEDPPPGMNEGSSIPRYGSAQCAYNSEIELGGQFMVQNNIWNPDARNQQQCITALWGNGPEVGFVVDPIDIDVGTAAPGSYPSIVYGWHYGQFHGAYQSAKQISGIGSAPTTWNFTIPSSGSWDAAYDLWLHPNGNPPDPAGGLELMIWMAARDTTPIGQNTSQTVSIGGATYTVWFGANEGGWDTVSYVRAGNTTSADFDLMDFVNDSVTRGYAQNNWYLLSVQAGYEPWVVDEPMTTSSFTISIN